MSLNQRVKGDHTAQCYSTTLQIPTSTRTDSPTVPPCPEWTLPYGGPSQNNRRVLIDNFGFLLCIREPDADAQNDRALMYVWRGRGTRRFTRRRPSGRGLRTGKGVHIPLACSLRGWGEGRDCLRCVGGGLVGLRRRVGMRMKGRRCEGARVGHYLERCNAY